jgi:hypothetical protein
MIEENKQRHVSSRPLRLLKFDMPSAWDTLSRIISENRQALEQMSVDEFSSWIIAKRLNYSDFYTWNLQKFGWECKEYFSLPTCKIYWGKFARDFGFAEKNNTLTRKILRRTRFSRGLSPEANELNVIRKIISDFDPDVIFVREPVHIDSRFWREFRGKKLIVSRIGTVVPEDWSPRDFDLILTPTEEFRLFFELNNVPSFITLDAFDPRLLKEVQSNEKEFDVTFIGQLVFPWFRSRVKTIACLSGMPNFKWWGVANEEVLKQYPILKKSWQGYADGLEAYAIHKKSKIVINDYIDMANGRAINQRINEVMGMGSFLLTKDASNLNNRFPQGCFQTFSNPDDCMQKINYFLNNEEEREAVAKMGQAHILENDTYEIRMKELDSILREALQRKFHN